MKARALPPYEALQELLHYDPETGTLTWKQSRGRVSKGQVAGSLGNRGYWHVRCFGHLWLAHRIAWKLQTGADPKAGLVIDHLNGDRADNRWANIRLTTQSVNLGRREVPAGVNPRHLYSYAPGRYTVRVGSGDDILRRNGLTFNEAVALAAEWRLLRYGTA